MPALQYFPRGEASSLELSGLKEPRWKPSSDCEKQISRAPSDAVMEVAVLGDFARAQCFSFVLIRHSQSCWLRGWFFHCEIMSLITRPV